MTREEVSALQVGQPVIFSSGFGNSTREIVKVIRRTLTQVVLSNGERINERGNVVGDSGSWNRKYVSVGTPEKIEEVRHGTRKRRLATTLSEIKWHDQSLDFLERVHAAVSQPTGKAQP